MSRTVSMLLRPIRTAGSKALRSVTGRAASLSPARVMATLSSRPCDPCAETGIDKLGITNPHTVHHNLTYDELFLHEVKNNEGYIVQTKYGPTFGVDTGRFTGRSPQDKWFVKNAGSESDENLWWGDINQPTSPEAFEQLYDRAIDYFNTLDECYVFDGFCGSSPKSRMKVRFVHELAWQQHFVKNMFIRKSGFGPVLTDFVPDFTIINACGTSVDNWKELGLRSEVAVAFNIEKKVAVIFGTWYGGENKKGIFSLMNYWLPLKGTMAMHCSANVGKDGDTALFFGLSGTGKTTLSADPNRDLIGDDEHGWDEDGIFNFEGGCYAKTIDLEEKNEPEIYRAIRTNALLENVYLNPDGTPDYHNTSKTQNGRVSYPIQHIENWHEPQMAGHPNNVIFLTCDAFGVLPPVARLTPGEAMYHFLSGYTAKVAGTELGVKEPQATFSTCYGAAFMTLHPTRYADLLQEKLESHGSHVFLVNTGWTGGAYGTGSRMSIKGTRACIDAIIDGTIHKSNFSNDPVFQFEVPEELNGVASSVCNPRVAWADKAAYDKQAEELAGLFKDNFVQYTGPGVTDYTAFGPKA